ncbi:MAG TPA: hypothetical protein ENI59_00075, partial [Euryarchaeota archaeon]|nr:hypothetical protein [Euryarchaeota archaeon]
MMRGSPMKSFRITTVMLIIILTSLGVGSVFGQEEIAPDIYEPDNYMMNAKEIMSGEVQHRTIYPEGDVDYVYFYIETWSIVTIETAPPSGKDNGDTFLKLMDSEGHTIKTDDNSGTGSYSKITAFLPRGRYFVEIKGRGTFEYDLYFSVIVTQPEIIFSIDDPAGDDYGPGTYVYPISDVFEKGVFDILKFEVYYANDFLGFKFTFSKLGENIYNFSSGFSLQIIEVAIDAKPNYGSTDLGDGPGVQLDKSQAWDMLMIIYGDDSRVYRYGYGELESRPIVWAEGSSINVAIKISDIPLEFLQNMEYWNYTVLVGSYDPNEETLWRKVDVYPGFWVFGGADIDAHSSGVSPRVIDMVAPKWALQELTLRSYNTTTRKYAIVYGVGLHSIPPSVRNLEGYKEGYNVTLTWEGYYWAEKYIVEAYLPDNTKFASIETGGNEATLTLDPGADYTISVYAVAAGVSSFPSTIEFSIPIDKKPTISLSSGSTFVEISITGSKYATIDHYEYEISKYEDFSEVEYRGTFSADKVKVEGLAPEQTYYVRVRTISKYGYISPWALGSFKTTPLTLEAPKIKVDEKSFTYIKVSWEPVEYADKYYILVKNKETGEEVFEAETSYTSAVIPNLQPATLYAIYVKAINSTYGYESQQSSVQEMTDYLQEPEIVIYEYR